MSQPIQNCFERYEKKYFLTPAGQKALLQTIAPYVKWRCCKKDCAAGGCCAILGAEMQKGRNVQCGC